METEEKVKRKRQKKLCKQIRDQMEFYFSDANLQKDRFLRKQIDQTKDGWLSLDMFSNFNKLKNLTTDMVLVAKALSTSELIQVSEDCQQIKRKFPVTDAKDVDDRTVYVEHLPVGADHIWVKQVFNEFGRVVYVSLPRYKSTRDLKGFGFVEYQTKEDAQRACKELNQYGPNDDKVGRFPAKHNKQMQELQKRIAANKGGRRTRTVSETEAMEIIAEDRKDALTGGIGRKRRWSQGSHDQDNGVSAVKRSKLNRESSCSGHSDESSDSDGTSEVTEATETPSKTGSSQNRKRKSSKNGDPDRGDKKSKKEDANVRKGQKEVNGKLVVEKQQVEKEADKEGVTAKKKKSRKKKKKESKKEDSKDIAGLKVISKKEWLDLRSEYLLLQKQSMKKLKQALQQISINQDQSTVQGAGDTMETGDKDQTAIKSKEPEFTAGVIVKIHSTGPLKRKELKAKTEPFGKVAYVDVLEDDTEAHVRCHSPQDATNIAMATVENYTMAVLTGDAEKQYWEKLVADRERKLNSKTRNKKRGKDKAIEKAGVTTVKATSPKKKHIVFDDD